MRKTVSVRETTRKFRSVDDLVDRPFNSVPRDSSRAFVLLTRASESGCKVKQLT